MCGIVGYTGRRDTARVLTEGLKRLEYRGYDSAGIAVFHEGKIEIRRTEGKLAILEEMIAKESFNGTTGIGHTRWATHGKPSDTNAHPHKAGGVAVVHNGIIENYLELKKDLEKRGHVFSSETDSEVISHLIDDLIHRGFPFEEAVRRALHEIKGSYALGIVFEGEETKLIGARNESPLVLGLGEGEFFIASDTPALLNYTRDFVFLEDGQMVVIADGQALVKNLDGETVEVNPRHLDWSPLMAEKGGFKHFMLKEIFEQPEAIINTIRGRASLEKGTIRFEDFALTKTEMNNLARVAIVACGTSLHAGLVGKFMIEALARIPVEVDIASEFRYRDPVIDTGTLLVVISQSGETADTRAALREGKNRGGLSLAVCNVVESSIAREADHVIYTHAGPEIGVASTKAFTTQLVALYLLALYLASGKGRLSARQTRDYLDELIRIPRLAKDLLKEGRDLKKVARKYASARNFLYLGRGINYPIALEGALKLKEISYIHAEGYPAGEMKHGPIALIDGDMPVVVLVARDGIREKIMGNIEEVRARDGRVIALGSPHDHEIRQKADEVISVPETSPLLTPILFTIPLQLLAYYVADFKGNDVDQPRNLAKSVTVE
ncbi:MAG: glutamine--fructose-6-phosphate transaminase (isomerizing) [Deltaproteobacteria bacterium]|nr:glutamine--fructose-6-phosphate transaminase (isomerizing) [Deltaproteobacteria bacterium]MBW2122290.1 glutamine--fructose-6-phosphate transaminase (isomerizing) [Deltaproteobacteria bacterium]